ncbi:sodium-dependent transporter [Streptomyces sp. HF10]|uniref:sodium-dependent transporter n=1 Tax=Streptomyces sp. HF10 TaxID=2692233 RepID=UPI0013186313|nr:sodium-dependent transporter [Streptomyces sp. HF10]QHC32940.1 sodium-dependent transporter [Streptomyces sp. HF10]
MPARAARGGRPSGWLHRRLGPAVLLCYLLALLVPGPGARLRRTALGLFGLRLDASAVALFVILFAAAFQVPPGRALAALRQPKSVLAGLATHLLTAFVLAPVTALVLYGAGLRGPAGGLSTAVALIAAAPVAAAATVWIGRDGDVTALLAVVLPSALLSPLTMPTTLGLLGHVLPSAGHTRALVDSAAGQARALLTGAVALPCALGLLARRIVPAAVTGRLLAGAPPVAVTAMLALTYVNATAAAPVLRREPWTAVALCVAVGWGVCRLAFLAGALTARALRLPPGASATVTLACGMSNVSVSTVVVVQALPGQPHALLVALVYGLAQKVSARRAVAKGAVVPSYRTVGERGAVR